MGVIINGSMNIGSGGISINTPYIPPYTGPICVSGAGLADGTYTFVGYQTFNGYTSPAYLSSGPSFYRIDNSTANGVYVIREYFGDSNELFQALTFPAPENPYLETQWALYGTLDPIPLVITAGTC